MTVLTIRRRAVAMIALVAVAVGAGLFGSAESTEAAPSDHLWGQIFGDNFSQEGTDVAMDEAGNVFAAGLFYGSADFGGGALTSAGEFDIYLAKFDADGNHLWSKRFGDGLHQGGYSVAVDSSGNVLLTGYMWGTVDFGGGALTSDYNADVFLAKFDTDGNHLWSYAFGGSGSVEVGHGIAVDDADNVILTGVFTNEVDFGGGILESTSEGYYEIFLAKFDRDGNHIWSESFGDVGNQEGWDVAVDGMDNIVVTGDFEGSTDFGGGALTSAGGHDTFLAKFDGDGNHLWSKRFGDPNDNYWFTGVAVDGSGNVVLTGPFFGSMNFGGDGLTSAGDYDVFLAKFKPNGDHLWSKRFGDADTQTGYGVAIDNSGNIAIAGHFRGSLSFGGVPLVDSGGGDIFVAELSPAGTHLWSKRFGDGVTTQVGRRVAVDGAGNVVATGYMFGSVDFGGGQLTSDPSFPGGQDIFLAKFEGTEQEVSGVPLESVSGKIGPGGGSLNTGGADLVEAMLTVPAGSIAASTVLTVDAYSIADVAAPPGGGTYLSRAYRFQPSGTTFSPPAVVQINYANVEVVGMNENTLGAWLYSQTAGWQLAPIVERNVNFNFIKVQVPHFSVLVIGDLDSSDYDGDGCTEAEESQTTPGTQMSGGLRDWQNPYDYMNPTNDGKNRIDDVLAVVGQYFDDQWLNPPTNTIPNPNYNPDTDRTDDPGSSEAWDLLIGNGQQRIDDILAIIGQYFHDCS